MFWESCERHFMLHVAPDVDDRNIKTKQAECMMSLPSALSVCHIGIPNVWLRRQVSFLFAEKRNIFAHRTTPQKCCFLPRPQSILNFYNTKPHIHMRRLTGSLAASWQRCTRLSNVDLRTMCSAGISFCSTLSAGSC